MSQPGGPGMVNISKSQMTEMVRAELAKYQGRLATNQTCHSAVTDARKGLVGADGRYKTGLDAIPSTVVALDAILLAQESTMVDNINELGKAITDLNQKLTTLESNITIPTLVSGR